MFGTRPRARNWRATVAKMIHSISVSTENDDVLTKRRRNRQKQHLQRRVDTKAKQKDAVYAVMQFFPIRFSVSWLAGESISLTPPAFAAGCHSDNDVMLRSVPPSERLNRGTPTLHDDVSGVCVSLRSNAQPRRCSRSCKTRASCDAKYAGALV